MLDTLMSMAKLSTARIALGKYATSDKEMTKAHTVSIRGHAETALHYEWRLCYNLLMHTPT